MTMGMSSATPLSSHPARGAGIEMNTTLPFPPDTVVAPPKGFVD